MRLREMRRRTRWALLALPLCIGLVTTTPVTALAATAKKSPTTSFVSLDGSDGDFVVGNQQLTFLPQNSSLTDSPDPAHNAVYLSVSGSGQEFLLIFAAPAGQPLTAGTYLNAEREAARTPGVPGIEVTGNSNGCNEIAGQFRIRDIAWGAGGALARLSLTFVQHCEKTRPPLFGEVIYREPVSGPLLTAPRHLDFPETFPGATVLGGFIALNRTNHHVNIAKVTLSGPAAGDYSVTDDVCSGVGLLPQAFCPLHVHFTPTAAGPRPATLSLITAGKVTVSIPLTGTGIAGKTSFSWNSSADDYIGAGTHGTLTPAQASFVVTGSATGGIHVSVLGGGNYWTLDMTPPAGSRLPVNKYLRATLYPGDGVGPELSVGSMSRYCPTLTGRFHVTQARYDASTGDVQAFAATFTQHCEGGQSTLTGSINYRAG
jgi:hypothetical protein